MDIESKKEKESLNDNKALQNVSLEDDIVKVKTVNNNENHSTGSVVCWERLLHVRSIRVLLVENDDCTRHIVTALLQKCNYEVVGAADASQAWMILEDLTNHIDLVLTEVAMPCVSGLGLLEKIMSHKIHKNVPVVMMSFQDSMNLVAICVSKGAVDFLVKPIRKNELKNLWQHVWRRCHSDQSSGSGSVSGRQTRKSVKSERGKKFDHSGSYGEEHDESNDLEVEDEDEDGSDAESSWTKQGVDVDNSEAMFPIDQIEECPIRTCSNAESPPNKTLQNTVIPSFDTFGKEKGAGTVIHGSSSSQSENPKKIPQKAHGAKPSSLLEIDCITNNNQVDKQQSKTSSECKFYENKDINAKICSPQIDCRVSKRMREVANISDIYKNANYEYEEPNTKRSLKKLRGVDDITKRIQDNNYSLTHSQKSSSPTRCNTSSKVVKTNNEITRSSRPVDFRVESARRETVCDCITHSIDHICSQGISNNIDMGWSSNKLRRYRHQIVEDKTETTCRSYPCAVRCVKKIHKTTKSI